MISSRRLPGGVLFTGRRTWENSQETSLSLRKRPHRPHPLGANWFSIHTNRPQPSLKLEPAPNKPNMISLVFCNCIVSQSQIHVLSVIGKGWALMGRNYQFQRLNVNFTTTHHYYIKLSLRVLCQINKL